VEDHGTARGPQLAIEATGLGKAFGRRGRRVDALTALDLSVGRGEVLGVLGPNGSGKSTLIRILSTLLTPDTGTARIFGRDVVRDPLGVRRAINRVSVEASFFKKLSAWENLRYAAGMYGLGPSEARRRGQAILGRLGLGPERFDSPLENLSRGQQQKVAIARALFTAPSLVLLDEPTTGLDPKSKRDVQTFVREIHALHDLTVLLCTHDMREAELLCQRVVVLDHGRIRAMGEPAELVRRFGANDLEELFFRLTGAGAEEAGAEAEGVDA
jgi:ABC-2 type transport system ATP-binding protein